MKKYYVIAAAALAALASCSKVETEPTAQNGPAISFQAVNYLSSTKADNDNTNHSELYKDAKFKVFAYFTPTNWATDKASYSATPFMNNEPVKWDSTKGTWVTETTTYYWPKSGALSFIAYYPSTVSGAPEGLDTASPSIKIDSYTVLDTEEAQAANITSGKSLATADLNDLMVTSLVADQKANSANTHYTEGVPMLFRHILAKVKVNAYLAAPAGATYNDAKTQATINGITYAVTLDDVQLKSIQKTGTYTASKWTRNTTEARDGNSGCLLGSAAIDRSAYTVATSAAPVESLPTDLLKKEGNTNQVDGYYVMPQTLTDASLLHVTYTIYVIKDGKIISATTHSTGETHDGAQADIKLNTITTTSNSVAVPINEWNENTIYTYNLAISPVSLDPIYFDVAKEEWTNVTSNPVSIQETK